MSVAWASAASSISCVSVFERHPRSRMQFHVTGMLGMLKRVHKACVMTGMLITSIGCEKVFTANWPDIAITLGCHIESDRVPSYTEPLR